MFEVHIWNDLQGDFIVDRDAKRKPIRYNEYDDAALVAMRFITDGVQAKVEYVRQRFVEGKTRKTMKAAPISRSFIREFCGETVVVTEVFNSKGRKVSK